MSAENLTEKNQKIRRSFDRAVSNFRKHVSAVGANYCDTETFVSLMGVFFDMVGLPLIKCSEFPAQQKIDDTVVLGRITAKFFLNITSPTPQVFYYMQEE